MGRPNTYRYSLHVKRVPPKHMTTSADLEMYGIRTKYPIQQALIEMNNPLLTLIDANVGVYPNANKTQYSQY